MFAPSRTAAALALLVVLACGSSGDEPAPAGKPGPAARVEHAAVAQGAATVHLSAEAIARVGIEVVALERRSAPETRTVGGVVVTSPGGSVILAAPQAGTVLAPHRGSLPLPGQRVSKGEPLLRMIALSPGELAKAREVLEIAQARVAVGEEQARAGLASDGDLDDARASLQAASARLRQMAGGGSSQSGLSPLAVVAPSDGVVRELRVGAGQTVPSGAVLIELIRQDPVWVRVPLYAGDLARVRHDAGAEIRPLGAAAGSGRWAEAVSGPPSADPLAASVDLFFSLPNPDGALRPGQVVEATLTLSSSEEALVVPSSAVIYDAWGNAWVYVRTAPGSFSRHRIGVGHERNGQVVLSSGPDAGTPVVSIGAAELFGTEFDPAASH